MTLNAARARRELAEFDFSTLFVEELGWDRYGGRLDVAVDGSTYQLMGVAEKRGMVTFLHEGEDGIPDRPTRRKIEHQTARSIHEHLIIFVDAEKTTQVWHWASRAPDRSAAHRENMYRAGQTGEALVQKLGVLAFTLEEEDRITIVDVAQRAQEAFDVERITRRFYERFNAEHAAFAQFVRGITNQEDLAWYASVTLNRLMFVYFIQKKGFLDGDVDYLRNRLASVRRTVGKDSFFSFYRHFLLRLFHEGLGSDERDKELDRLLGAVPYLNGGLFEVHTLEERYPEIDIPDESFERLFDFFDTYQWHLDDRPVAEDNEINPDVLGYIFEKYINQKEMGAYYTQADVTGYMAAQTVIPWLFARCGLLSSAELSELIQAEPERYLFDAVLAENVLPGESDEDSGRRERAADELLDRMSRLESVAHAELQGWNLNLLRLAHDVIRTQTSPTQLRVIYDALRSITILDPTCGSGAFLLAAANVLGELARSCLNRARELSCEGADDDDVRYWKGVVAEVQTHPSEEYFVLRGIILANLYGVDLMDEAVEICKLRLFLKLAAQLSEVSEVEPLPDIDFNIRCGNTLVGFATASELGEVLEGSLDLTGASQRLRASLTEMEVENRVYHEHQHASDVSADSMHQAKVSLLGALTRLADEMDAFLAGAHGVERGGSEFENWRLVHHPFHWLVDFNSVMEAGGFDVILGNPPYVELPKEWSRDILRKTFRSALDEWSRDEDLCTLVVERSLRLLAPEGSFAMILPLSVAFSTKRPFRALRQVVDGEGGFWFFSHYDRIPSALFGNEVRTRCTIAVFNRDESSSARFTSPLLRWTADARPTLFQLLNYSEISMPLGDGIAKVGSQVQADTLAALLERGDSLARDLLRSVPFPTLANLAPDFPDDAVYVGGTAYNWFPVWREIPETTDLHGRPSLPARTAGFLFDSADEADVVFALLASSLGYWWWAVASDGFNLKKWLLNRFPLSLRSLTESGKADLAVLGRELREELPKHYVYKDNRGRIGNFFLPGCRAQISTIDDALADAVPELSADFFADIRHFNENFSRAMPADDRPDS